MFLQELVAVIVSRRKLSDNMRMSEEIAAVDLGDSSGHVSSFVLCSSALRSCYLTC